MIRQDSGKGEIPARTAAADGYQRSPLIVFYEVTQACDLVCLHCRACAQSRPSPNELSEAQARRLMEQIAEFPQPPMLVLTGGDPFKRPDIFDLVRYAVQCGLLVSITPSATPLVTHEALARLQASGISRVAISIDGADAGVHDAFRGVAGSFARSLEILRDARTLGIATQINTTISPANIDQLDAMASMVAEAGAVLWSIFFLVPVGRAESAARLTASQYEEVFAKIWRHSLHQPYAVKTTEAPHFRRFLLEQKVASRREGNASSPARVPWSTNDGKGILFVSHAGLIHPSGFLPVTCGVYPLNHVVKVYQESPIFRGLRNADLLEGKCGRCEFRKVCGGSRARAFAVSGSIFGAEPDCVYEPT